MTEQDSHLVFEVWYRVFPTFRPEPSLTAGTLQNTHRRVNTVEATDPDLVYSYQQGEVWSQGGSQRQHLADLGVGHTSMSVGDVLVQPATGRVLECADFGWREIGA